MPSGVHNNHKINSGCFKKGHINSENNRNAVKIALRGKKRSPETIEKMRRALWKGGKSRYPDCEKCGKKLSSFKSIRCNNCKGETLSIKFKGKYVPSGKDSPHWILDRNKLKKSENKMNDYAYRCWMIEVKNRDLWKCRLSNSDCKGRLESHHIFNWVDYPELRYVINNGITLCHFHHPRKWEEEKRMIPIFQELLSVSKDCFD